MGKIISVSNQKGGVGKTTTTINLASFVAQSGKKVLIIDADPQGNASSGLGIIKNQLQYDCYGVILGEYSAELAITNTTVDGLSILPCSIELAACELDLVNENNRESKLKEALSTVKDKFDYIFIDCPPSLGLLTLNALIASDEVIIPIQSEFFALEGLAQLMNTIKLVKQRLNPALTINGVVLTMYDSRTLISQQVTDEIYRYFGDKIYTAAVPRNVKLVEAPSFGIPILVHAPRSSGAMAYGLLAKQFLERTNSSN